MVACRRPAIGWLLNRVADAPPPVACPAGAQLIVGQPRVPDHVHSQAADRERELVGAKVEVPERGHDRVPLEPHATGSGGDDVGDEQGVRDTGSDGVGTPRSSRTS